MKKSRAVTVIARIASGAILLVGCAGSDPSDEGQAQGPATARCANEDRAETFFSGMAHSGDNGVSVQIDEASPAPPALHDNEWTLTITDADGAVIEDATVDVKPFMPDHDHFTNRESVVKWVEDRQEYDANPVNFMMPGYWEVRIEVETPEVSDRIVFKFCIPG